jgi:secreted trypsin-like serine protease
MIGSGHPHARCARALFVATMAATAAITAGCGASPEETDDLGGSSDAVIGGTTAAPTEFPATVYLRDGCTAAKIGPRLVLTAAHCVFDTATTSVRFTTPGSTIAISRDPKKGYEEIPVARVHVHASWMRACEASYCGASVMTAKIDAADVAVIELGKDLDGVAIASVDTRRLRPGDPVVIVGFGCTKGVLVEDQRASPSLAWAETKIVPPDRALHEGSAVKAADQPIFSGSYAMTAGPGAAGKGAGICPGDSGGPLYRRAAGGGVAIVGVNSNYTFKPEAGDAKGLPVTNWHTRLDDESRHGIAKWLGGLGR